MNLKLTVHVQMRIYERSLDMDHIKQALREPDTVVEQRGGKKKAIKKVNEKTIVVIYCSEMFRDKKDEYLVIIAYYL